MPGADYGEFTTREYEVTLGENENILYSDRGGGFIAVHICPNSLNCTYYASEFYCI